MPTVNDKQSQLSDHLQLSSIVQPPAPMDVTNMSTSTITKLLGGLEHELYFSIQLGMS